MKYLAIICFSLLIVGCQKDYKMTPYEPSPAIDKAAEKSLPPIKAVPPRYPSKAITKGICGWVKTSYKVSESGKPIDIIIEDSFPKGLFEKAAEKSLKQWRFDPNQAEPNTRYYYVIELNIDPCKNK